MFSFPLCPISLLSVALFWSCDILCFMASVVSATVYKYFCEILCTKIDNKTNSNVFKCEV